MPTLPPAGVAMLIFKDQRLSPPHIEAGEPTPGIRATTFDDESVLLEAVGYADWGIGNTEIARAEQACIAAGLLVKPGPMGALYPSRLVKRA